MRINRSDVRLAVDIGGTFTDIALEYPGGRATTKVLTTAAMPEVAVIEGVQSILNTSGIAASDIGLVIHGTTLATNALIERKGARTALLTTDGFRDVIAMGNESRYDQYDLNITLPEPLIPRNLRMPIVERLDNTGRVLKALDEDSVRIHIPELRRRNVASIAVGLLHSFVNDEHERRVRAILREELPDIPVSLSSEVSPEMREWERLSTTAANAYVQPMMSRYLRRLEEDLRDIGLTSELFLMMSGGSLTTIDIACRFPVRLVESGPAGGAMFSAHIARERAAAKVLSFDMGGTTAKICLIDDYQPQTSRALEVARVGRFQRGSGLPLRIPVIEMVEIGAGGGSIAHVDSMARIQIGPESAGADPGPACYGRGGVKPTVTDANLLLGRYDPERFAGGSMTLDEPAAQRAIQAGIASPLGLTPEMAALGGVEVVDENMANAARMHAIESGKTYEGRTMIAFGGGGPVHACRLAEKLGIERILVPSGAGVGSAIGFLRAPVGYEVVRSLYQRLSTFDTAAVNELLESMHDEARRVVDLAQFNGDLNEIRMGFMRYVGQGHEIPVPLPAGVLTSDNVAEIFRAYEREYTRLFDRPVPGSDVEVMSYSVVLTATVPDIGSTPSPVSFTSVTPGRTRLVRDTSTGAASQWPICDRTTMTAGTLLHGPAIVTEDETSTIVAPGWRAIVDGLGYMELIRNGSQ